MSKKKVNKPDWVPHWKDQYVTSESKALIMLEKILKEEDVTIIPSWYIGKEERMVRKLADLGIRVTWHYRSGNKNGYVEKVKRRNGIEK